MMMGSFFVKSGLKRKLAQNRKALSTDAEQGLCWSFTLLPNANRTYWYVFTVINL